MAIAYAVPVGLAFGLVRGEENLQAFCFGALCPAGPVAYQIQVVGNILLSGPFNGPKMEAEIRWYVFAGLAVYFTAMIGSGLLALWVRRMVDRAPSTTKNRPDESTSATPGSPFA